MREPAALDERDPPLDPSARLRRRRRERLLALLPRIFAAQPRYSAVGAVLDAMAGGLVALDQAAERVLRDRWVALAGGEPRWDDGRNPLELLGLSMGVPQEPWEDTEAYRRRLRQIVPVLLGGSNTVRSILALAAACLDTELCPELRRLPDTAEAQAADIQDTTLGLAVRPGERCAAESGGPVAARLLLTDSPVTGQSLSLRRLGHNTRFQVPSQSLAFDRPALSLSASAPIAYPALQNLGSKELMLYAGPLDAGETLTLAPARIEPEIRPFNGYTPQGPALDFLLAPRGSAVIRRQGASRDVSDRIFYVQGAVFDDEASAHFDVAYFALMGPQVLSPRLDPGVNAWLLRGYTKADVKALVDDKLRDALKDAPDAPFNGNAAAQVDLTLDWWVRIPASFRLSIPEMPARASPEERTAVLELVRRTVEAAHAAGVHATVDFPEPPRRERHELREGSLQIRLAARSAESQRARDVLRATRVAAVRSEQQPQEDTRGFTTQGVFDVTRFEWSHLAPPER